MDVEFVIPSNKDELLQYEPGQYCVSNVCGLTELSNILSECKSALSESGSEFIIEYFDHLFSVLVHFKQADFSTLNKGWNVITRGYGTVHSSLQAILEEGEMDPELRLKILNITKMATYLLTQYMRSFEDKLSAKSSNGILIDTGRGKKKSNKRPEYEDFNWEQKNHDALVLLYNILQLPLNKLWDPPIAEEEFVNLIADSCYKSMEDPGIAAAKMKYTRETIFQVLGTLIKRYNHGLSCSIKIIHLLKLYEHLVSPLAQGVVQLVKEFGCRTIVRELVREIGETDGSDLMQDTSGTRAFSQFLVEIAESVPELILQSINLLTAHLSGESHSMRMCVLGIMGEIVLRLLSVEDLDEASREMRDEFLDHLEDHLHDNNAFVRIKVLQIWHRLCRERSIPLARQSQLLQLVVGRLQDKSSNVKKNALQLVTTFLEVNPFAFKLSLQELEAQLKKELKKLETLEGKTGDEMDRRKQVTEAGREQAWSERETDIAKVIEDVLKSGKKEDEPATQVLTQNSLAECLESIRLKIGQKNYLEAYYVLRNAEKQFPGAEALRCDMGMEEQVGYFMNLLHKIFVECNSSEESSQPCSQGDAGAGPATQGDAEAGSATQPDSETKSKRSSLDKALENQQALVQYLTDTIKFVEVVSSAIPVTCQLLRSKQNSDVIEAVEFFTSAFQFGMVDAITGVRQMLLLVWSKDQAIKDAVASAYRKLYLDTEGATGRAHAVQVIKNLSSLLKIVDFGQQAALEELVRSWVQNGSIDKACIQVMWERFSMNIPETTEDESLASLILLGMVARAEVQAISSNIAVLVNIGLGERGIRNYRLAKETCQVLIQLAPRKPSTNSPDPPLRYPKDHEIFTNLKKILTTGFWNMDDKQYIPFAAEAVDVIYQLSEQPDDICKELLVEFYSQVKRTPSKNNQAFDDLLDTIDKEAPSSQPASSQTNSQGKLMCPEEVMARFMFLIGHISLRQMLFLDVAVFCELKRRNALREARDEARTSKSARKSRKQKNSANSSHVSTSASETPRNRQDGSDDEMGLVGAVADDQEAEFIRNVCETDIVTGDNLLAFISSIVIEVCSSPHKYRGIKLQRTASLALAKMMMVSSMFCENNLQLLVTILEKSTDPVTRSNLIVALGDLSYRFPNITEPWTPHVYGRLRDSSSQVRQNTMMVLTHLIMHDMVKVKGQISEMAQCIVDAEEKIADKARIFFSELSTKGNALYNVMPDIISRLSSPDLQLEEDKFRTIMKFIMGLIQKDKQMESLVDKLCLRFLGSQSERQWCDLAFCLSLVQYSDRCLRRLQENLPYYADKLHSPQVFETFCNILATIGKTTKPELKAVVDELEAKIRECNAKGAEEAMVAEKATAARRKSHTPRAKPGSSRKGTSSARRTRGRQHDSDSSDSDTSDKENHANKSTTQSRQSARLRTSGRPPPVIESDDESDEEHIFVRPKGPAPKTPAVRVQAAKKSESSKNPEDAESSDEDLDDSVFASPIRKKHCSGRESKTKSVSDRTEENTPRNTPISTPKSTPKNTPSDSSSTRSTSRVKTRSK